MFCMSNSVHEGLEHCITAPVDRNPLIADDEIMLFRSMTDKRGFRRQDTILDRLSEQVKVLHILLYMDGLKFQSCVCIFILVRVGFTKKLLVFVWLFCSILFERCKSEKVLFVNFCVGHIFWFLTPGWLIWNMCFVLELLLSVFVIYSAQFPN